MERLNEGLMDWMQKHQSRRGFLATLGKVSLGIGLAMAGAAAMPTRVFAAQCCQGPLCTGAQACAGIGCNAACTTGGTYVCCDKGGVGSTGTVHSCQICYCPGMPQCDCESDTGVPC